MSNILIGKVGYSNQSYVNTVNEIPEGWVQVHSKRPTPPYEYTCNPQGHWIKTGSHPEVINSLRAKEYSYRLDPITLEYVVHSLVDPNSDQCKALKEAILQIRSDIQGKFPKESL